MARSYNLSRKAAGMERYSEQLVEADGTGQRCWLMGRQEDGVYVKYADAQRALDAEREKVKGLEEQLRLANCDQANTEADLNDVTSQLATLQAQLRQVEGDRQTLRQLVKALPVYKDVSISHRVDENDFETWKVWVDHNPLAECDTEGEASAIKGLLTYRATLAAQDAGKEDVSHD
jgi:seryl-tRNA synthetase